MGIKSATRRIEYRKKLERMATQTTSPAEAEVARRKLEELMKVKREVED